MAAEQKGKWTAGAGRYKVGIARYRPFFCLKHEASMVNMR